MFVQQSLQPKLSRRRYINVSYALQNNTVFRRAQTGGELCRIFKFWSFLQSKRTNNIYKLLQLMGILQTH